MVNVPRSEGAVGYHPSEYQTTDLRARTREFLVAHSLFLAELLTRDISRDRSPKQTQYVQVSVVSLATTYQTQDTQHILYKV